MAATEARRTPRSTGLGRIVLAACALPGVLHAPAAQAEEAPEQGVVEFKLSRYTDNQSASSSTSANGQSASGRKTAQAMTISAASGGGGGGGGSSGGGSDGESDAIQRLKVTTPSIYALVPLGRHWSIEGSATVDQVSGASPSYYTDTKGFANFSDRRSAVDAKLTRYFERQAVALGVSHSKESDYVSNALSAEARFASADQNTTFNFGLGLTRDRIDPTNHVVSGASKATNELQAGVTQALSTHDLVQASWTYRTERGYLNDPYKLWDQRPDHRNANIVQLRWNHWLGDSALKTGYRFYADTYGIRSHTVDLALAMPVGHQGTSTFTPEVRWYTQSAASFYVPFSSRGSYPAPLDTSGYSSLDQRLAAFGAVTLGAKLDWQLSKAWSADFKFDFYRQQSNLRLVGTGSGGLAALTGTYWQAGLRHTF